MTNTRWRQAAASPLHQKVQLLKFYDIAKLQLHKIMHFFHNNKISNLYLGFPRVKNLVIIKLEILLNQTTCIPLQEPKKANQPFPSKAQKYGVRYPVI